MHLPFHGFHQRIFTPVEAESVVNQQFEFPQGDVLLLKLGGNESDLVGELDIPLNCWLHDRLNNLSGFGLPLKLIKFDRLNVVELQLLPDFLIVFFNFLNFPFENLRDLICNFLETAECRPVVLDYLTHPGQLLLDTDVVMAVDQVG